MKIVVSSPFVFKYVTEYVNTFDGYISTIYDNLLNYDLTKCEELIVVQWYIWRWLPDYVFTLPLKISILNTEQLVYNEHKNNLIESLKILEDKCKYKVTVYDYSKTNCRIIEENGFISKYHEYVSTPDENEFLKSLLKTDKIYDIGFVGGICDRRSKILDTLKQSGISVLILDTWGVDRDIELSKCKYILNIHWNDDYKIFEALRCNRWIQAGFKIITETSIETLDSPNVFSVPYDNLVEYIKSLLKEEN